MNQPSCPAHRPTSKLPVRKRRLVAFALLILSVGGIWLLQPNQEFTPSVTILPPDYSIPSPPLPLPDRWIPPTWGLLWKLRYAVLGKPLIVNIQTEVLRFGATDESPLPAMINHHVPLVTSNGVGAWVLPEGDIASFRSALMRGQSIKLHGSQTTLGQGVLANLSMTTSPRIGVQTVTTGDFQTYAVRKLGDALELSAGFVSAEVVTNIIADSSSSREVIDLRTNLTLVAIMRIPRGHGVFLFDTNRAGPGNTGVGLVIHPKVN